MNSVHIHCIGVWCWFTLVVMIFLGWIRAIGFASCNSVHFFPLGLEVNSSCIPSLNGGGYGVHGVDSSYEGGWNSSRKEVDEHIIVIDFTEGCVVFELGYVIPKL